MPSKSLLFTAFTFANDSKTHTAAGVGIAVGPILAASVFDSYFGTTVSNHVGAIGAKLVIVAIGAYALFSSFRLIREKKGKKMLAPLDGVPIDLLVGKYVLGFAIGCLTVGALSVYKNQEREVFEAASKLAGLVVVLSAITFFLQLLYRYEKQPIAQDVGGFGLIIWGALCIGVGMFVL